MPDLTIIDGDGPGGSWATEAAQEQFEDFARQLLRRLAGGGSAYQVSTSLHAFLDTMVEHKLPLGPVVDAAVTNLSSQAFGDAEEFGRVGEWANLVRHSLRVAAESMANDSASKGRQSRREDALVTAVEAYVIESERRSREHGWSYTEELVKRLGPSSPKRR